MLDRHDRLPAEPGRILNDVQFRRGPAVKHRVEPKIALQSLGRTEFVFAECNDSNARSAFDFDESHLDESGWVFGVRSARNQVETPIVGFYAFHYLTALFLVAGGFFYRDTLDLVVAHHGRNLWAISFRVWCDPGAT